MNSIDSIAEISMEIKINGYKMSERASFCLKYKYIVPLSFHIPFKMAVNEKKKKILP